MESNAAIIVGLLTALCTTGGVVYLAFEKIFNRSQDREKVRQMQDENKKDVIEYGIPMIQIYQEIDKIVASKTQPIQDKLDKALERIDTLEDNWVCWRKECPYRAKTRGDAAMPSQQELKEYENLRRDSEACGPCKG